ncbi:hypothetical protein KAW18_18550, partial [candidate division WOR-3 bacterium]|nr:hypothetical protein [candidate division WOR-3 bacterium]
MAHDYKAWVRTGGNWAASCGNGWYYSYSKAGESMFSGYAKIRTSVYILEYRTKGWTPPPFGNDGREITERWLSQDYYGFWDLSGLKPVPKTEYMPIVFDDEMLFTSFNAFDEKGRIGPINDYFHTTCMLNCMLSNAINEEPVVTYTNTYSPAKTARFRFEDLFRVINHAWCMYPPPVGEGPGDTVTAMRYSFKGTEVNEKETKTSVTGHVYDVLVPTVKEVAWAWREYWKDIERGVPTKLEYEMGIPGNPAFNFVEFNKPEYYFDCEKTEHRLITDEGKVAIIFVAPSFESKDEPPTIYVKEDGGYGGYKYPEISIKDGVPRKFEIFYDDYNNEQVEWMDEGGDGTKGGSGGEEEKSIYEEAMGSDWFHDDNTIFDGNASSEKNDDRKILLSKDDLLGDTVAWYNRGLIANISKDRLIYLPYRTIKLDMSGVKVNREPDILTASHRIWYNKSKVYSEDIIFTYDEGLCIFTVDIFGRIGVKEKGDRYSNAGIYCHPEITINECAIDDVPSEEIPAPTELYKDRGEKGDKIPEKGDYYKYLETYDVEIKLSRMPKRVLYKSPLFQVKFTLFPNQHFMLNGFEMNYGEYVDAEEEIKVWEQKYVVSTGEFGD